MFTRLWSLGLAAFCVSSVASALPSGIATGSCNGCHVPDEGTGFEGTLALTPSATLEPGQSTEFTLRIEEPRMKIAGYFISANGVGMLEAGTGNRVDSEGIVHSRPATATDGVAEVTFTWTAPEEPGGGEFYAFVVAANDSSDTTGDLPGAGVFSFAWGCEGVPLYEDIDGDGFGKSDGATSVGCGQRENWATQDGDCNDLWANINPDAPEVADNGKDDDCDGQIDAESTTLSWYSDSDGDGYGSGEGLASDVAPDGMVDNALDCDDADANTSPAGAEVCDGRDNDCDASADENLNCALPAPCAGDECPQEMNTPDAPTLPPTAEPSAPAQPGAQPSASATAQLEPAETASSGGSASGLANDDVPPPDGAGAPTADTTQATANSVPAASSEIPSITQDPQADEPSAEDIATKDHAGGCVVSQRVTVSPLNVWFGLLLGAAVLCRRHKRI